MEEKVRCANEEVTQWAGAQSGRRSPLSSFRDEGVLSRKIRIAPVPYQTGETFEPKTVAEGKTGCGSVYGAFSRIPGTRNFDDNPNIIGAFCTGCGWCFFGPFFSDCCLLTR